MNKKELLGATFEEENQKDKVMLKDIPVGGGSLTQASEDLLSWIRKEIAQQLSQRDYIITKKNLMVIVRIIHYQN